ncbi:MAG: hypothetical protein JWP14_365 [Frankiales bacterium]|nr:hypothetical protein [Frankiales bacterium]
MTLDGFSEHDEPQLEFDTALTWCLEAGAVMRWTPGSPATLRLSARDSRDEAHASLVAVPEGPEGPQQALIEAAHEVQAHLLALEARRGLRAV